MEEAEKVMNEGSDEREIIKAYLLGSLGDEAKMRQIEEKLLLDDVYAEELTIAEDALIEEYLDGELTLSESEQFNRHFLAPPERRQHLRMIENLRKIAASEKSKASAQFSKEKNTFFDWRKIFFSYGFRFAAVLLLLVTAGFGVWRIFFYQSDTDKGLAQLRQAYRGQRPLESRTTADFDYAPLTQTRGEEKTAAVSDIKARTRAEGYLLNATENSSSAKAHQALGLLYLTDRKFDLALDEFNQALKASPNEAGIYSDIGATLLERAKQAEQNGKADESLGDKTESLKAVNRALEINPALPEALFNRALVLQKMGTNNQAQAAWEEYLKLDSVSPWAEEARRNLELLKHESRTPDSKEKILDDFLTAYRSRDDATAWKIVSQTKELVTGVMIAPQLVQRFLETDAQQPGESRKEKNKEILSAFFYAGKLEAENAKDPFFSDWARYYSRASESERGDLLAANEEMKSGYQLILKTNWKAARDAFERARTGFTRVDDSWDAALAEFQICYCLCQLREIKDSNERLLALSATAKRKNYRWLTALVDGWVGSNYSLLGEHSKAINYNESSLKTAQEISDIYNMQKAATQLAHEYWLIGDRRLTLLNIERSLNVPDLYFQSPRQKSRNLLYAAEGLYRFRAYDAAAAFAQEEVQLAENVLKDNWLSHTAHNHLALIYGGKQNYEAAFQEIASGFRLARSFPEEPMRQQQSTKTRLILSRLQRESGDCTSAANNYKQVIENYENSEFSINKYEALKGQLLCSVNLQDDSAVKEEMPRLLEIFDENRREITAESDRNTFFDNEQSVYDIAIDYTYSRLQDEEQAFNYAENSRARSLLSRIENGQAPPPLTLSEFRKTLPAGVQVIYYAVLTDKVLIWYFSNNSLKVAESRISEADLDDKIHNYLTVLIGKEDSLERAKDLYQVLIEPVESVLEPGKPVCIIADKSLFRVPFASLISSRTNKYFIENYPLLYAPSASVFSDETKAGEAKISVENETILSIGNPSFSSEEYPELADLPDAEREAEQIAALYHPAKVFAGSSATKEQIINSLDQSDIVHFAGHYVPNQDFPESSKFILAAAGGGDLTVEEITQRKLTRPRLMILSACETGVENFYKGEGMIGAARAFLAANVPLAVASQWAVDTRATAQLMISFHRFRKQQNLSTIAALRQTQIEMLRGGNEEFRHPFYWAGFMPIGGYVDY